MVQLRPLLLACLVALFCSIAAAAHAQQRHPEPILLFARSGNVTSPRLQLTDQGAAFLQSLEAPFAIISAVGPTRTGKSFLLNQLANARIDNTYDERTSPAAPFSVGPGVVSHTHGLWIWPQIVWGTDGVPTYFVDSEGLHGVEFVQSAAYEVELFVHATMLSSSVIYNTWAPMDAADVRTLKGLAAFARLFMMDVAAAVEESDVKKTKKTIPPTPREDHPPAAIPEHLDPPSLHWAVQNFNQHALTYAHRTPAQFLDQLLRKDAFLEDASVDLRFLHQQFRTMQLAPLSRPSDDDALMAGNGRDVTWTQLKDAYKADMVNLVTSIKRTLRPKSLNGTPLSGTQLVALINQWDKDAPVQIQEHTAWHRAVAMKLEHEATRLLDLFNTLAAAIPIDNEASTYEQYRDQLTTLAATQINKMKRSVTNLGDDTTAVMMLAYLEKQLDTHVNEWTTRYVTWATSQIQQLADKAHADILAFLTTFLNSDTNQFCKDWWFTHSLRTHLDRRIDHHKTQLAAHIKHLNHHFPKDYDPASLRTLLAAGTGLAFDRTTHIESLKQRILLTHHSRCPHPITRAYTTTAEFVTTHHHFFTALAVTTLTAAAIYYRNQLLSLTWSATRRIATRIATIILAVLTTLAPVLAIAYILYIAAQVVILDRETTHVRYTPSHIAQEFNDATAALTTVVKGTGSVIAVLTGTALVLFAIRVASH
ncbi:hypothetical protein DFJ77DRAFT_459555 [Powellomyces hirtus]|nr:hypothetical protein DFJ77DRAFT_459555 [Powellomyces hirtus]